MASIPVGGLPSGMDGVTIQESSEMREQITLECTECKRRNYTTMKEKRNTPERLEKKKYCKFERKHTLHKETR